MVTTTIIEVLKARTAQALRAFLCLKSEHFKHLFIFFRQRLSLHHLEYQNVPDSFSDRPSTVSLAPSQRTTFLHLIIFIPPVILLPIEFDNFFKLAHILLYRFTYISAYRDDFGEGAFEGNGLNRCDDKKVVKQSKA